MKQRIAGYILAGGGSTRFGRDKALVEVGGRPMIGRMSELVRSVTRQMKIVAAPGKYEAFGVEIVEDRWPGEGPLGGVITGLEDAARSAAPPEWNLIVSCDMPFVTREWLSHVIERTSASDTEVIVPRSEHGLEPLCACWMTAAVDKLHGAFDEGVRKVTEAMKRLRMEVLDETHWKRFDSAGRLFWNMNTPQDYEEAVRIWRTEHE
jgi:molybdopterin-guanine dinucleotide biosynthesis protein A